MSIEVDTATLRQTRARDYLVRFFFGGTITAATGWIGHKFGPGASGLFLAFPAILPASLTLCVRHDGREMARKACQGAALGSIGLFGFALVIWQLAPRWHAPLVLAIATLVWMAAGAGLWAGTLARSH